MQSTSDAIYALCPEGIAKRVNITVFDELDSTNTYLKRLALSGAKEGTVIIARRQSAGRGRLGRSFFSPDATGLYISVLLRPRLRAENAVNVTAMAAVAAAHAIKRVFPVNAQIKWVNDIFVENKKVCGILCESKFDINAVSEYVVVGAGVNVCTPKDGFPKEIESIAGALADSRDAERRCNELAAVFLEELFTEYENLEIKGFIEEYRRLSLAVNRRIAILSGGNVKEAEAVGIDDECRLIVRYDNGEEESIATGEISIKLL